MTIELLVSAGVGSSHPLAEVVGRHGVTVHRSRSQPMALASHILTRTDIMSAGPDLYHYPHFNLPVATPSQSIVTIHDLEPLRSASYFRRLGPVKRAYFWAAMTHSVTRARAVITPSHATADALSRVVPWARRKIQVIYEGVDELFRQAPSPTEVDECRARLRTSERSILYVGVDRPHKNLRRLLQAFARIAPRVPHVLVMVGQALVEGPALRELALKLGIADRVSWLGYVADQDLRCLYRSADLLALCSLAEGFGLEAVEAMASGLPVVVSNVGALEEIAGLASVRVDPYSVESIADGLLRVCTDPVLRSELREQGLRRASRFTWRNAAEATMDLYRLTLGH